MKKNKHCIKSWNQIQTPWIKIHYLSELDQFIALLKTYEIERNHLILVLDILIVNVSLFTLKSNIFLLSLAC